MILFAAHNHHISDTAWDLDVCYVLWQVGEHGVRSGRRHNFVVRGNLLVGVNESVLGRQDHHQRESAGLDIGLVCLEEHALVKLHRCSFGWAFHVAAWHQKQTLIGWQVLWRLLIVHDVFALRFVGLDGKLSGVNARLTQRIFNIFNLVIDQRCVADHDALLLLQLDQLVLHVRKFFL